MSDISSVIIWWLTFFIVGATTIPLTFSLFPKFIDRGYIFSKVIGIVLASYLVWFLGSAHILPFARMTVFIVLIAVGLANLGFSYSRKSSIWKNLPWVWIILEEILFFVALAAWSYVRATEPSIRGLEKFMDFGFVNSILRSSYFPPLDMWLTKSPDYTGGYFINYYYFGHYITAFLTKLSGIDSAVTYNLMIATLFAFTFTLPFSIGANLMHVFRTFVSSQLTRVSRLEQHIVPPFIAILLAGLLAGFLVSLGGNLHTLYVFTSGYPNESPQPPWNLSFGYNPDRYWYPNATRFIPYTIHEFPIYSFVVSDLHGHVSDIPMVLFIVAFLFSLIMESPVKLETPKNQGRKNANLFQKLPAFLKEFQIRTSLPLPKIALLGLLLAVMYMTNAWDGLIYMVLCGLSFLLITAKSLSQHGKVSVKQTLLKTFSASLFLVFFFLVFSLPFSFNFRPFASGIGFLCTPKFLLDKKIGPILFEAGKCQRSDFWMLVVLWGFFYYNVIGLLGFAILPKIKALLGVQNTSLPVKKIGRGFIRRLLLPFAWLSRIAYTFLHLPPTDQFMVILVLISTLLLIFPEFFYLKDIYPAHYRANTMFKLGYQAFMMLGIVCGYTFFRIKYRANRVRGPFYMLYNGFYILLFTLVAIYPYFAVNSYYASLKTYHGLFGLNWFETQYPDDFKAVQWIRENITCREGSAEECINQPVIAEAQGDSYTDYARVSSNTGLPTIVGWPVHEWLWRGSYDEAGKRIPEVTTLYESKDLQQTKDVINKYKVQYVFVGALEREKYKNLEESKFTQLGKVVFENGATKVYKLNSSI